MCVSSVFLSVAAAGTHASPPHRDTHQTLFSFPRSSPDLSTSLSPSHTYIHTYTVLNPCFSLLAGQLSVPVLSLCHLPLSCIHHFISLPPSLSGSDPEAAC